MVLVNGVTKRSLLETAMAEQDQHLFKGELVAIWRDLRN